MYHRAQTPAGCKALSVAMRAAWAVISKSLDAIAALCDSSKNLMVSSFVVDFGLLLLNLAFFGFCRIVCSL